MLVRPFLLAVTPTWVPVTVEEEEEKEEEEKKEKEEETDCMK